MKVKIVTTENGELNLSKKLQMIIYSYCNDTNNSSKH